MCEKAREGERGNQEDIEWHAVEVSTPKKGWGGHLRRYPCEVLARMCSVGLGRTMSTCCEKYCSTHNTGKENEYIPKYLSDTEDGEKLQDIIQVQ